MIAYQAQVESHTLVFLILFELDSEIVLLRSELFIELS